MKMLYECETRQEEIETLQQLIDSGTAWKLEGFVGRSAMAAITSGECILGKMGHYGYWGNYIPSRTEVESGTKGSLEYQQTKELE